MASAPFWVAMICQIIIVVGYFWFYRKEQLGTQLSFAYETIDTYPFCSTPMITTPHHAINQHYISLDYTLSFRAFLISICRERTVTIKDSLYTRDLLPHIRTTLASALVSYRKIVPCI